MPKQPPVNNTDEPQSGLNGAEVAGNLVACVVVAGGLGFALDRWLGWAPWGLLGGLALGFAAWLRGMWRLMRPKG